jgi:hypothetical protein
MSKSKRKQGWTFGQRLVMLICTAVVGLGASGALAWGLWGLVCMVDHGTLAAWALVATGAVPVGMYVGYRLGGIENRGVLAGLGLGVDAVTDTANKVADVKVATVHRMRNPEPPEVVQLPPLPPVQYITSESEGEIIDV